MLELITDTGHVGIPDDGSRYRITHKWNGLNTLHFELSIESPMYERLAPEALIYETTEGQTYAIKGIDAGGGSLADVDCELDLYDWRKTAKLTYYNNTSAISATMAAIVPTGWTVTYDRADSQRRSVNLPRGGTPMDIALEAQNSYSCAMQFDTANRVCRVYYPQTNPVSDTVITESAAMRGKPAYTGTSSELVTRIYPVGADGLTIGSVNGGKNYVENHSYTDKVICQVWTDERYENAAELKADAQALVDSLAVPAASWEIPLIDLHRADPEKWPDHRVELYQKVQVQYGSKQFAVQVSEETVCPYHPEENTVTVGTVAANAIHTLSGLADSVNNPNSAYNSKRDAAVKNATAKIVGSSGGHVVTVLDGDGRPEEICILSDTDDISTAQSLWRWNEGGLGHSSTGYNGEYSMAITKDGAIVADRITTGTLDTAVLNVEDIFAKNITAKGTIYFRNNVYSMRYNPDTEEFEIKTSGIPMHLFTQDSGITLSCQWRLKLQSGHEVLINGETTIDTNGGDMTIDTLDSSGNYGGVIINGKKLTFADDGTVRWEATT